jgi:predicted kinase
MPNVFMLIGPPASGKSTVARALQARRARTIILSSDSLREFYQHWSNAKIFREVHQRLAHALRHDQSVIFDATNTQPDYRRQVIVIGRKFNAKIIGIIMTTPLETCLTWHRSRQPIFGQQGLTNDAITRYYSELQRFPPRLDEGFDRLLTVAPDAPHLVDMILHLPA